MPSSHLLRKLEIQIGILILTLLQTPPPRLSYPLPFTRLLYLTSIVHNLLISSRTATKRDIYYMNKELFGHPRNVDLALEKLARLLKVERYELGVLAVPKGLVAGDLWWRSEDAAVDVKLFGSSGTLVPQRPECLLQLSTTAKFVLIVEKETVFLSLTILDFVERFKPCIVITGKGKLKDAFELCVMTELEPFFDDELILHCYPDYATRNLVVRTLLAHNKDHLPSIPLLILTDADPHGAHIASVYFKYVYTYVRNARSDWIGVLPSEYAHATPRVAPETLLHLQEGEKTLARNMKKDRELRQLLPRGLVEVFLNELSFMLEHDVKFEVEALVASTTENVLSRIRRCRDADQEVSHPVLNYVARKLDHVMSVYFP